MLTRWDPFREMISLREAMDRLFEESFIRPRARFAEYAGDGGQRYLYLPVDVYTTEDEVVVHAMLPGVSPEDVDISFEGNTLTISGEIPAPAQDVNWIVQETAYGPFRRTITLNIPVNTDKAEAVFENGWLTLHLPKAEEVKPKHIKVKAK